MRILATSDLHYPRHKDEVSHLAQAVNESGADAFILGGDISAFSDELYREVLGMFLGFQGLKLAVAGNHDLWVRDGNSLRRYREDLRALLQEAGFHYPPSPFPLNYYHPRGILLYNKVDKLVKLFKEAYPWVSDITSSCKRPALSIT